MGLGCWYELIYAAAIFAIGASYCLVIIFNLLRWRPKIVFKLLALTGLSMVFVGFAYLVSELLIDFFNHNSCSEKENFSALNMIIVIAVIIFVNISVRKQEFVVNRQVDLVLAFVPLIVTSCFIIFEVLL